MRGRVSGGVPFGASAGYLVYGSSARTFCALFYDSPEGLCAYIDIVFFLDLKGVPLSRFRAQVYTTKVPGLLQPNYPHTTTGS